MAKFFKIGFSEHPKKLNGKISIKTCVSNTSRKKIKLSVVLNKIFSSLCSPPVDVWGSESWYFIAVVYSEASWKCSMSFRLNLNLNPKGRWKVECLQCCTTAWGCPVLCFSIKGRAGAVQCKVAGVASLRALWETAREWQSLIPAFVLKASYQLLGP